MGNQHVRSLPAQPTSRSEQPSKIGNYIKSRQLGEGGQGQVYLVQKQGKEYALKMMKTYKDRDLLYKLRQQVKIMRYLSSEHILPVKEQFQYLDANQDEYYCIVTQKCQCSLVNILTYQLDENTKMDISKQLITAIAFIHKKKVVHRDLKPENILYIQGRIKICDFGLSKIIRDHLKSDVGTTLYKPYQLLCGKYYDQRVDIWPLGLTLIQIWMGRRICYQIQNGLLPCVQNFSWSQKLNYITNDNLRHVVSRMVQKQYKDRITAKQALQNLNLCLIQEREGYIQIEDLYYNQINKKLRECPVDVTHLIIRQGT